jgi:hypothetical protein
MFATTRAITHARAARAVKTTNSRRATGAVVVARANAREEQKVRMHE